MTTLIQRSFGGGVVSPEFYGRQDMSRFGISLSILENVFVRKHGGISNRNGFQFINKTKLNNQKSRLLPFIFEDSQAYCIELGHEYLRVIHQGAYVTYAPFAISAITNANPMVVTIEPHSLAVGDHVTLSAIEGMSELNGTTLEVHSVSGNDIQFKKHDGSILDSTNFDAYISGGGVGKIIHLQTPYSSDDIFDISYAQSLDIVSVTMNKYKMHEIQRLAHDNWRIIEKNLYPNQSAPQGIKITKGGSGSNSYRYRVTALNENNLEESLSGVEDLSYNVSNITNANPCVVTTDSNHDLKTGDVIIFGKFNDISGLIGNFYSIEVTSVNQFRLRDEAGESYIDSTNMAPYASSPTRIHRRTPTVHDCAAPSTGSPNILTWSEVTTAGEYNIYREDNGVFGFIGTAKKDDRLSPIQFKDVGISPDITKQAPELRDPFSEVDDYPSAVAFIQQRRALGGSINNPSNFELSQIGNFDNYSITKPIQDDSVIRRKISGDKYQRVRHFVNLDKLVVFTSGSEWVVGDSDGSLTQTSTQKERSSYGSGKLKPLKIGNGALFIPSKGNAVRDFKYFYELNGFNSDDITIFASHLFNNHEILDWTYQESPNSLIYCVRDDGALLSCTFVREHKMIAWHVHTTPGGVFESVCSIPEGNEDVLYAVIKRNVNGQDVRYIERLKERRITDQSFMAFSDSHLSYDGRNKDTSHLMTASGGVEWIRNEDLTLTSSKSFFKNSLIGNSIDFLVTDENGVESILKFEIVSVTSQTVATVRPNITVPVSYRNMSFSTWSLAVDKLKGLEHLENKDVSIVGDKSVVASPFNPDFDKYKVVNGELNLDTTYSVIHVGLPYISDMQNLNIDTVQSETLIDKNMNVNQVTLKVIETRGLWIGRKKPYGSDYLKELSEYIYGSDVNVVNSTDMFSGDIEVNITADWRSNGAVFVRQVDPLPFTILSMAPSGLIPIR